MQYASPTFFVWVGITQTGVCVWGGGGDRPLLWGFKRVLPPTRGWETRELIFCVYVPVQGMCSGPSKGPLSRARMDNRSRTMYSLHLGTCKFTRVRYVPKEDTTGGKTWV